LFYLSALLVFLLDRALKSVAFARLAPAGSLPVIKGFFNLTYVRNTGVAFGLFPGQRLFLILIGIIVCFLVVYYHEKSGNKNLLLNVYLGLILGGSLGNLFDRVVSGYVTDYMDFRVFPVFNLADMCINLGVILIILNFIMEKK
jgi:signal peptidase II